MQTFEEMCGGLEHRFCLRHLYANYKKKFGGGTLIIQLLMKLLDHQHNLAKLLLKSLCLHRQARQLLLKSLMLLKSLRRG
jgi:hypothetical protein